MTCDEKQQTTQTDIRFQRDLIEPMSEVLNRLASSCQLVCSTAESSRKFVEFVKKYVGKNRISIEVDA